MSPAGGLNSSLLNASQMLLSPVYTRRINRALHTELLEPLSKGAVGKLYINSVLCDLRNMESLASD